MKRFILATIIAILFLSWTPTVDAGKKTGKKRTKRGVTHEDVEKLEGDAAHQKGSESKEDKLLQKQWDEHMHDFVVEDMLQVELPANGEEVTTLPDA